MQIRKSNFNDCSSVAELHEEYLTKSFLGSLGPNFLRLLYGTLTGFENSILLVAEHEGKVIGFIAGTMGTGEFYKYFLQRNFLKLAFVLLPKVFSIKVIKNIFETAKYSKKRLDPSVPDAELLSMAISNEFQGKNVARQLFNNLVDEFQKKGISEFKIVAGNKLEKANHFYQKMGCEKIGDIEVHEGNVSVVYRYSE